MGIVKLGLIFFISIVATSCTVDMSEKYNDESKKKLVSTEEIFRRVNVCSINSGSNDAKFSKTCPKLVDGKILYGLFKSAKSAWSGGSFDVSMTGAFYGTIKCNTKDKKSLEILSDITTGSHIIMRGSLSSFYVSPYSGKDELRLKNCLVRKTKLTLK